MEPGLGPALHRGKERLGLNIGNPGGQTDSAND